MLTFSTKDMSSMNVSRDAAFSFCFVLLVQRIGRVFLKIYVSDANVNIAAFGKLALVSFCVHPRCWLTPALAFLWE